ncbi:hypothetical protein NC653_028459 [Populus alba x Populus x berolinensis]|uniref:Uncharacterized protein n=1 Tax=Populus alba x Populus x berolinensis TaxID=444605 RepID=A0AAD6LZT4_9ROSI|nr:hypothetical protein NC653_028459 [Populus alba x Populus x berolinensis]
MGILLSVVLPGGSGYGSPLSTSPLGIALSLIDKDCPKGKPLVIKSMPLYFDFGKPNMSFVLVRVCLPNHHLECWSPACLSKISSVIGKPIRCDDLTLSMSRVSFARVMIEVNVFADLPHSISLSMSNGTIIKKRVIYEYKPRFCD